MRLQTHKSAYLALLILSCWLHGSKEPETGKSPWAICSSAEQGLCPSPLLLSHRVASIPRWDTCSICHRLLKREGLGSSPWFGEVPRLPGSWGQCSRLAFRQVTAYASRFQLLLSVTRDLHAYAFSSKRTRGLLPRASLSIFGLKSTSPALSSVVMREK